MPVDVPLWAAEVATALPYPLIFATVCGAYLYRFACADSDLDLRAAHVLPADSDLNLRAARVLPADSDLNLRAARVLPAAEVVGLRTGAETLQSAGWRDGVELDVVSHDLRNTADTAC